LKLNNKTLEKWLEKPPKKSFKHGETIKFIDKYDALKKHLVDNVYPQIAVAASMKEKDLYLNDHGINHINTVIKRASELVSSTDCNLLAREVYYLLCAILLHDVGNVFGRESHERNSDKIISECGNLLSVDTPEQNLIWSIAKVHGGKKHNGENVDTINELETYTKMRSDTINTQFLASILRFADELADDNERAAKWVLKHEIFPDESKIFHEYSSALYSVDVDPNNHSIELNYSLREDQVNIKYKYTPNNIYLIDYIYKRVLKMHLERIYCMRYMRSLIYVEKILVNINFVHTDFQKEPLPQVKFTVMESGYPSTKESIFDLCPNLNQSGNNLDGAYFCNQLK